MDFYSQRLNGLQQDRNKAREARDQRMGLPLGRPGNNNITNENTLDNSLRTMAETPQLPEEKPQGLQIPDSMFKEKLGIYEGKDDDFNKDSLASFASMVMAAKKDLGGINLPEDLMKKRVDQLVTRLANESKRGVENKAMAQRLQQQTTTMGGGIFNG